MTLSVLCWNMYWKNTYPEKALDHILSLGHDVFCLQEIPDALIPHLRKQKEYTVSLAIDAQNSEITAHLGILVRRDLEILSGKRIRHVRGLIFKALLARMTSIRECIESHSLRIRKNGQVFNVVNCHLPLYISIAHRHAELRAVAKAHFRNDPIVFCGDLNLIGEPILNTTLGPFFGVEYCEHDVDEDLLLHEFSKRHRLKQAFKKVITLPLLVWSGYHLDHILVDHRLQTDDLQVFEECLGSDHLGLSLTVAPAGIATNI